MSESKRGSNGGNARSEKLSKEERKEIASKAAKARWAKKKAENNPIETTISHVNTKTGETSDPSPIGTIITSVTATYGGPRTESTFTATTSDGTKIKLPGILNPESTPFIDISQPQSNNTNPIAASPAPVEQAIVPVIPNAPKTDKRTTKRRARLPKEFGAAHSYAEKRLADAIKERAEAMGKVNMLNAEIPSLVQIIKALKTTESPIPSFNNPQAYQTLPIPIAVGINPNPQAGNVIQQAEAIPPAPIANGGAVDFDSSQQDMPEDAFLRGAAGGDRGWV